MSKQKDSPSKSITKLPLYVRKQKEGSCPCCKRHTRLSFHHLIPKKMHRRAYFKKHYCKQSLALGVNICRKCHDGIHKTYNEMTLAKQFNQLSLLQNDPQLANYFAWVSKQKIKI